MRRLATLFVLLAACGSDPPGRPDAGALLDAGAVTADGGAALDGGSADAGAAPDAGLIPDAGQPTTTWDLDAAPVDSDSFPEAVQAGDVTSVAAVLWTRFAGSGALRVRVVEDTGSGPLPLIFDLAVTPTDAGYVHADVGGLRPNARYRYAFLTAEERRSPAGRFRTAPTASTPAVIRFGASSCTNQSRKPFPPLARAAEAELDFFLLLGDTSYNDGAVARDDFRAKWRENLSTDSYRSLFRSTSHYATWDDHEVTNDWDPETVDPNVLATASAAFFETLAVRRFPSPSENRVYRSFRWGTAVEVFVLDCRGERRPSTRFSAEAEYISKAQMEWLKAGLQGSTAAFKIIANSVPIANFPSAFDLLAKDRWEGYESQREQILGFIEQNGLRGVVWVSGDFHLGSFAHVERTGPRAAFYDVLAGPGGNVGNPVTFLLGPPQFELASTTNNYVDFEADPTADPPTLRLRFIDGSGQAYFEKTLNP